MSKRNDIMDAFLNLLRAGSAEYLSSLDDETEIVRGPEALMAGLERGGLDTLDISERKLWAEVGDDDIDPASLAKDGHSMAIYVLVAMRATERTKDMPDIIDFGDEVERAIMSDRKLAGQVQECHPVKFTPGWWESEQDVLAIVQIQFEVDFHTTN